MHKQTALCFMQTDADIILLHFDNFKGTLSNLFLFSQIKNFILLNLSLFLRENNKPKKENIFYFSKVF